MPRRLLATLLILLVLTREFHPTILAFASTSILVNTPIMAKDDKGAIEFLKEQLEKTVPSEGLMLERRYVVPEGMSLSDADRVWMSIAPFISLGYDEGELIEVLNRMSLPKRLEVDNATFLIDYSSLRIARNMEEGEVSVEIPVICNGSLSSTYYEITGVKKLIRLSNITFIRLYEISVNASELFNVTYSDPNTGRLLGATLNFSGDLKTHRVQAYFPDLKSPASSEICIGFPPYGVVLSLQPLEHKVGRIRLQGWETDFYWIRVKSSLKTMGRLSGTLYMGHSGGWVIDPWLLPQAGEHVSEAWIKWVEGDGLTIEISFGGFRAVFSLVFGKNATTGSKVLSTVIDEGRLRELLGQPSYGEVNLSRVPKSWRTKLVGETVTNETTWVTPKEYERLMKAGYRRDNSLFIDSGEAEWEYSVTNRTLGPCKSVRLLYNPLKVSRGELVHSLVVRNYAGSNVSYTLRLRATSNHLVFFSKTQEGSGDIVVGREDANTILLVQREPAAGEATLELVKDGKVISAVRIVLALRSAMFWKGFWDGLASKLPGIVITAGVMVAIGFLIPHAYIRPAYYILLGLGVAMCLLEIAADYAEACRAREEMLALADALENRAFEFLVNGSVEHATGCTNLALAFRREVNETMRNLWLNILSDVAIGVSVDEIKIALGLKEPVAINELERQYKIGYARGRVTGSVIQCVLYVTLFVMLNKIKFERATGQRLTAKQVLGLIARGIYNWITPAIWDAMMLAVGKGKASFNRFIDLLLGNSYSRRFGEAVGSLIDGIRAKLGEDCSELSDALESSSDICKQVLENVLSKESSGKILDVVGSIVETYSWKDVEEKGGALVQSVVVIWIKDGDEAVNELSEWLNANPAKVRELADEILLEIKGDVAKGVGLKIRDVADNYFNIKDRYGINTAKIFVGSVLHKPELIEVWKWAVKSGVEILATESGAELKLTDIDGERYMLIVNDDGSLRVRHMSMYNEYPVKAVYDAIIKDKSGRTIIMIKCIEHSVGTARLVLERNILTDPLLFIDNKVIIREIIGSGANRLIEVEEGQTSFEIRKILQLILGTNAYEEFKSCMEGGMAVVGLVYRRGDKIDIMWTSRTFLELEAVGGVNEVLGIAIAKAEGMSFTGGATTLKVEVMNGKKYLIIVSEGIEKKFEVEAGFRRPQYGGATLDIQLDSGRRMGFRVCLNNDGKSIEILPVVGRGDKYNILPRDTHIEFFEYYPILGEEKSLKNILIFWYKEGGELYTHALSLTDPYITAKDLRDVKHTIAKYSCMRSFKNIGIRITGAEFAVDLNENEKLKTGRKKVIFDFIGEMDEKKVTKTVPIEVKHGYEEEPDLAGDADSYVLVAQNRGWVMVYYFLDEPQTGATKNLLNHLIELARKYPGGLRIYIEGRGWIIG